MAKILSSKAFIEGKKQLLKNRCEALLKKQIIPTMNVILVGKNPASLSYVKNKKKLCQEIGANCEILELEESINVETFLKTVANANSNKAVHGIIIQLPLPVQLQTLELSRLINPEKDLDGFHPNYTLDFYYGKKYQNQIMPCTPSGIMQFMEEGLNIDLSNKLVCLIGRSVIVGKPLLHLLNNSNATVIWCHSKTKNLSLLTAQADIVISAVGKRKFLDQNYFSKTKPQLIIDVGITGGNGKSLAGDLDCEKIQTYDNLSYTPVPGGVGPLTVYKLVDNLIYTCEQIFQRG